LPARTYDDLNKEAINAENFGHRTGIQKAQDTPRGRTHTISKQTSTKKLQQFLSAREIKGGLTRLQEIWQCLYSQAISDKSPKQIEAAKVLFERAFGKPRPSDDELGALAQGGIQLVYIAPPDVPKLNAAPTDEDVPFIPAEIIPEEE
jgi:hypothetical protein